MPITLRNIKGSELTFNEVDNNFKSYFYTASLDGNTLKLTYFTPPNDISQEIDLSSVIGDTGSFFIDATVNGNKITFDRADGTTLPITVNINTGSFIDNVVTTGNKINYQRADGTNFTQTVNIFPFTGSAVITGSLEVTGSLKVTENLFISASENSNVPNIALYDTSSGELFYTASSAVGGGGGGSGATLSQELQPNLTVGGVDSSDTFAQGSTIEALLRTMLITFQSSTLGNFTLQDQFGSGVPFGVVETNTSYDFNKVTISAGANDPNGNFPVTSSFQVSNATSGDFTEFLGNGPLVSSNQITFSSPKTVTVDTFSGNSKVVTYKFTAKDPDSLSNLNKPRTQTYVYPTYYGNSLSDFEFAGNVEGSLTKVITTKQNTTNVLLNFINEFVYFCYPARYGDLTSIKDGNNFEIISSFTKITRDQSGTAAGWSNISYNIYKSDLTSVPNQTFIFKF